MKLTTKDSSQLSAVLATCAAVNIESIIIDGGIIRGINETKSCAIISDFEVPGFPQKIGLTRLRELKKRIDLFNELQGVIIDAKESERGEITSIEVSAGKNKVQFRCTATALIKAPKVINDFPVFNIFVNKGEMKLILDAAKAMGSTKIQLAIKKDGVVTFTVHDSTNDGFNSVLETKASKLSDDVENSVVHYYLAEIFSAVMRSKLDTDIIEFQVGEAGTIKTTINGHSVSVLSQIDEDGDD